MLIKAFGSPTPDAFAVDRGAVSSFVFASRDAKTIRDPRISEGENTAVFIVAGQSQAANYAEPSTPTNGSKIDQISIDDGGTYAAVDPLLGCNNGSNAGNLFIRVADKLITNGTFDRVILVPCAIGGTSIALWTAGGVLHSRLLAASARCAARSLPVTAVLWHQGERDGADGMGQSTWEGHFANLLAAFRATGEDCPWIVARSTLQGNKTSSAIRAAQAAVVFGTVYAGPDTDTLTGGTNRSDGTHFTATGANSAAELWVAAIDAVF